MTNPATNTKRRSAWTLKQKIARVIWGTVMRLIWILLPSMRSSLIRMFGGKVGRSCRFSASSQVYIPWNVSIGDDCEFGEKSIIYSLGMITIGDRVLLDFRSHLCAGTHDMSDPSFPLLRPPITIGNDCVIGADAYIGPNVTLGAGCLIWPRASVYKDAPEGTKLLGNPARPYVESSNGSDDVEQEQSQ